MLMMWCYHQSYLPTWQKLEGKRYRVHTQLLPVAKADLMGTWDSILRVRYSTKLKNYHFS